MAKRTRPTPLELFEAKINRTETCWLWTASLTTGGYGKCWFAGRQNSAHKIAYELWVGPVPEGLHLDHLCRVRHCVNPSHLEPVTCRENLMRGTGSAAAVNAAKTHCPQGHAYDEQNTCYSSGRRYCRACGRENQRRYRERQVNGAKAHTKVEFFDV